MTWARMVHPHERGEYYISERELFLISGSSPRTWGIRSSLAGVTQGVRFIPTNVGNTNPPFPRKTIPAVHPHERGEYSPSRTISDQPDGSSPRTWGIRPETRFPRLVLGFIPTNVGNTAQSSSGVPLWSVHPHERGEYDNNLSQCS